MFAKLLEAHGASSLVYVLAVVVGATITWWALKRFLARYEGVRRRHVLSRRSFEAIDTSSPVADPIETARQRGLESINSQFSVVRRVARPVILLFAAIFLAIPFLDVVPASALSFVVGALTVIIGIAMRPIVENAIAGLAMAASRSINIGDTVLIDSHYGTVEDISLTHTTIKVWDWRRYVVPNSVLSQQSFLNYSTVDGHQWAYVEFWVSYQSDLEVVEKLALDAARSSPAFDGSEEPAFWLMDTTTQGVRCWVAAWSESPAQAWNLKHDMRSNLAKAFRTHGIRTHQNEQHLRCEIERDVAAA